MVETLRRGCRIWLSLLLLIMAGGGARAQTAIGDRRLYVHGDTLKLDVRVDSLFSRRALDAIESGMTTSIVLQFRLNSGRKSAILEREIALRLEHDIWEGRYRVFRYSSRADTLHTDDFGAARRFCSELKGVVIGPLPPAPEPLVLLARVGVNPISPEQKRRTRKWLNFLEKGSLLELFISLDRPSERTRWMVVERFTPAALPRSGPEATP